MNDLGLPMTSFESDYNNGAHAEVLRALLETNDVQTASYGADAFSESARQKIRIACEAPDAEIYFLTGGTQTNATVISTILKPYEGVIALDTGHISVHEAGAVEITGHKVLQITPERAVVDRPDPDAGKMNASQLEDFVCRIENEPSREHCVFAGMVYISLPKE